MLGAFAGADRNSCSLGSDPSADELGRTVKAVQPKHLLAVADDIK